MKRLIKAPSRIFAVLALLLLSGCATTLAPHYDQTVVDGLNRANTGVMRLFASISSGTSPDTYKQREQTYNNLIGDLDALTVEAKSRPIPKNSVTKKVNAYLQKRGVQVLDGDTAPSATAMANISKTLVMMRDTDKKQGLTAFEVAAFKGQVLIYLDQATTYENFLKR